MRKLENQNEKNSVLKRLSENDVGADTSTYGREFRITQPNEYNDNNKNNNNSKHNIINKK